MYQHIYGGGQGGPVPPVFAPGLPFPMGYQPGPLFEQQMLGQQILAQQMLGQQMLAQQSLGQRMPGQQMLGQQMPGLGAPYTHMPVHAQATTCGQGHFGRPPFPGQAHGYQQAPNPPAAHYGGGGDNRRRRHFTEAPPGQPADSKRQAFSGAPLNMPSLFPGGDDDVGRRRRYDDAAPGPPSRSSRQGGNGEGLHNGAQRNEGGRQSQQQTQSPQARSGSELQQQQQQQQQPSNGPGRAPSEDQDGGRCGPAGPSGAGAERWGPPAQAAVQQRGGGSGDGDGGGDGAGPRSRPQRRVYSVLGRNIRDMVEQLSPTDKEVREKEQVLMLVRQAAQAAFPEYQNSLRVEPFGSYMCGLGTKSSDIDVVLVGLAEPSPALGFYSKGERPRVARLLDRLTPHLRSRLRVAKLIAIRHARVPILKITTSAGVSVDISIAGMSGPAAANFIRQQVSSFPALRPLVLVLKSYMRELELGEVAKGGLSSYGLTYMVMAHLMEEARRGSDTTDLGSLLHSLLRRYGRSFDMGSMAVSVRHGGLVPRGQVHCGNADHVDRIVTIDPLTGRNITEGTFRSDEVLQAFARADTYMTAWAARRDEDVPADADILAPLVSAVPDEDEEEYVQEYAPPANGAQLGKRGRSEELTR